MIPKFVTAIFMVFYISTPWLPVQSDLLGANANKASNNSHHLIVGNVTPVRDTEIFHQIVTKSSSLLRVVVEDVTYPPPGVVPLYTITCIRALDQYMDGEGGYATLKEGGVGFKNVTLHLKSQRGNGFNFIVEVWGHL
ncbi:putative salivary secreted peptide [Arctopsyche grandis]|uniref:putative salivary secreted peptide n=1 Tax=Arctopsyche grandis TaxID=121162 RepID=UPI00406D880A